MGLRDALKTWLTPLPAMDERAVLPPPLPYLDNYWPAVNFTGGPYGIGPLLQQTLLGNDESVSGDFSGLTLGALQGNAIVYALEKERVNLFKQARPMWRQLRSGRPGELFSTPALDILRNPWPGGTTADLLSAMALTGDIGGTAFVIRRPGHLFVPRPDWVTIVHGSPRDTDNLWDADAEVLGILYQPGGQAGGRKAIPYLREEVAIFIPTLRDPLAPTRGMSWMTPVLREITADTAATSHKLMFFRNGATPNLVVTGVVPAAGQSLMDWTEKFNAKTQGIGNAYKTLFFTQGVDAKVVGNDLQQIDFKVVQGAGESRLAAAAGVPPVVVGFSEGLQGSSLNAGNFSQAMRKFADLTGRPWWADAFASLATIVPPPPGAELFYDDRDIPALKDDIKDAAEVLALKTSAIRQLIDAGYEPDAVIDAINAGDIKRLAGAHSGLYSVQLQPPMPEGPEEPEPENEEPADE